MRSEAARRRTMARIRLIKTQWVIIGILLLAFVISLVTRPSPSAVSQEPPETPAPVVAEPEVAGPAETEPDVAEEPTAQEEPELIPLGSFKTTAYCTCVKCCGIWSSEHPSRIGTDYVQKTATGTIPTEGRTIAVDPDVIPFGTVVIIDGHEYIAEDTGSAVVGNTIDIYFASHDAALQYGVQTKTIYIKGE